MANRLGMAEHRSILGLARLGWSGRRIAVELGIDRQTVSRYLKAAAREAGVAGRPVGLDFEQLDRADPPDPNATTQVITGSTLTAGGSAASDSAIRESAVGAIRDGANPNAATDPITGSTLLAAGGLPTSPAGDSAGRRSRCEPWRTVIITGLEHGLTARRIWQDLKLEHGFADSYQSVQRFVRRLGASTPLPFRRMECEPGAEAQVDFGKGAPIVSSDGKRKRPHLFRIVLSCSRKAYSEVVPRQTTEHFLRCIENAFRHFGGVPKTLVIDNLKAAVTRADWYDPDLNPKILAFAAHYGTTVLPTKPYTPRHKGKIERGVGYAQSNALKGKTFGSYSEENQYLLEWESTVADTRIHGTTRQQVKKMFEEVEKPALLPLPPGRFPSFQEAQRIVNRDGHVEVARAYYSAPPEFVGRTVWARWDGRIVRLFDQQMRQIAVHAQREPGRFATDQKHIPAEKRGGIERGTAWWLQKAHSIGVSAGRWAQSILEQRGVHGIRVLIGLVSLTKRHAPNAVERACEVAQSHGAHRLRDIRNLLKRSNAPLQEQFEFVQEHPLIRSLTDYSELIHHCFQETRL